MVQDTGQVTAGWDQRLHLAGVCNGRSDQGGLKKAMR